MLDSSPCNTIIGLASTEGPLIGILSAVAARFPLHSGQPVSAGVPLIASALSFGILSIAGLGGYACRYAGRLL